MANKFRHKKDSQTLHKLMPATEPPKIRNHCVLAGRVPNTVIHSLETQVRRRTCVESRRCLLCQGSYLLGLQRPWWPLLGSGQGTQNARSGTPACVEGSLSECLAGASTSGGCWKFLEEVLSGFHHVKKKIEWRGLLGSAEVLERMLEGENKSLELITSFSQSDVTQSLHKPPKI